MDLKESEILKISKECFTEYVTASRTVTAKPCWVFNVIIDPINAILVTQCYLRNGEMLASEILVGIAAQFSNPDHISGFPMYFNKGLFVELNANIAGVTVQYLVDW